jgi:glycogen phosphorylase
VNDEQAAPVSSRPNAPDPANLLQQYGCGPIAFTGSGDALYERHLMFDAVLDPEDVGPRERYEAVARSVRDVLSQRWHRTEHTYDRENPKRVYYLSMEFLIGRSLSNNILNLRLDPIARNLFDEKQLDALSIFEEEPDAGCDRRSWYELASASLVRPKLSKRDGSESCGRRGNAGSEA